MTTTATIGFSIGLETVARALASAHLTAAAHLIQQQRRQQQQQQRVAPVRVNNTCSESRAETSPLIGS